MVDISDYVFGGDEEPEDGEDGGDGGGSDELSALKACLQALADAVASTNLAVINATQDDSQAATARVQASVGALKRFHAAFQVLKGAGEESA
jgi:hypothetical protein